MSDFKFLQNKITGEWVISAPRRSTRTNVEKASDVCPFCPEHSTNEEALYQVGEGSDWRIRVVKNKFPFAPIHEIIIHSPDHHKNFDELPQQQVELILKTYRERFNFHKGNGNVYIFHNSGSAAGASLSHPHTQLVVIPQNVKLDTTPLDPSYQFSVVGSQKLVGQSSVSQTGLPKTGKPEAENREQKTDNDIIETEHFLIFCPTTSEWPDEVWIAPRQNGGGFGFIKEPEITDMAFVLTRLIQIFDLRNGHEFPFNFYIPPLKNWYLRLIPRTKTIGGFELGTNIIVNTQDPSETFKFIQEHFWEPDHEKIKSDHQAEYRRKV